MGRLSKKDKSILFKNKKESVYIPIKGTKEIYLFNEVSLNTKLLNVVSRSGIVLHFFNYYGYYVGTFYPKKQQISGRLKVAQVLGYVDKRVVIAKAIIRAIALNIKEVLYHYYRHGAKELKPTINYLNKDVLKMLDKDISINQVLFIEGQIWLRFYDSFKYFLPKEFLINKRLKRPPNNPMNALISFGNSLLYSKTITALYKTHLDQSISFLHEVQDSRFSLSLDLSEAFKPIIVFKTIFELVNRKMLQVNKHFNKELNYAILNEDGKKIFISAFEKRLNEKFMHSSLNRMVSYNSAIRYDGYKLIKFLIEDKEFMPFLLKDKR